ncbi:MAG TPA: type II toxin-antitoxin system VapC family toxin [Campylobacterales bacterium]|nr:type II toxin-antitoxin system VapC family toxin [Campylobacterales bacterium]
MDLSNLHRFSSSDKIIIDANVLIYVYCPLNGSSSEQFTSHYSSLIQKIVDAKASVYVNSLVVSEFINYWLRLDYKKSGLVDFKKDYRSSERYKMTMKTILNQLGKFYKHCSAKQLNDGFATVDLQDKYKSFAESDFNDIVIAENAKINKCKVLTEDRDFEQYGVEIVK